MLQVYLLNCVVSRNNARLVLAAPTPQALLRVGFLSTETTETMETMETSVPNGDKCRSTRASPQLGTASRPQDGRVAFTQPEWVI